MIEIIVEIDKEGIMMNIQELEKRIKLPEAAGKAVDQIKITEAEYQEQKQIFDRNLEEFIDKWKNRENKYEWALKFYLMLCCETYEVYKEKGIAGEIFDKTFYDITIWCEECYRKYQIYGLEEIGWIAQSVKMNLFRLGRLQFEPYILKENLKCKSGILKRGTEVLNVHIPAGEPLDHDG